MRRIQVLGILAAAIGVCALYYGLVSLLPTPWNLVGMVAPLITGLVLISGPHESEPVQVIVIREERR